MEGTWKVGGSRPSNQKYGGSLALRQATGFCLTAPRLTIRPMFHNHVSTTGVEDARVDLPHDTDLDAKKGQASIEHDSRIQRKMHAAGYLLTRSLAAGEKG